VSAARAAPALRALVIGAGNALAGDDAAGLQVARRVARTAPGGVRVLECGGDQLGLVDDWAGVPLVVMVDAMRSGARPGVITRLEVLPGAAPHLLGLHAVASSSTHGFGLNEALGLGRALGRLPRRLVVFGIEGGRFDPLAPVSPAVAQAVALAARRVQAEIARL
jgi:hydrogenase maturation protease